MRPTETMPSLRLPHFRRAERSAFGIVATVLVAGVLWTGATAAGARLPWMWGGAGVLIVALPGLLWSTWFELGIRCWNRSVRILASALRLYTLIVYYYLFFPFVGAAGCSLDRLLERHHPTTWMPRDVNPEGTNRGTGLLDSKQSPGGLTPHQTLLGYARTQGNGWAFGLVPLVWVLAMVSYERQECAPPTSTYTLY